MQSKLLFKHNIFAFQIDVLLRRLSDGNAVAPLNYFNLSNAAFLSGIGLIATYLIILIQFKASE